MSYADLQATAFGRGRKGGEETCGGGARGARGAKWACGSFILHYSPPQVGGYFPFGPKSLSFPFVWTDKRMIWDTPVPTNL